MRKLLQILVLTGLSIALLSCRSRNRMAEYNRMIDSIRKAEVTKDMLKNNVTNDPVKAFFDTLSYRPLPVRYSAAFVEYLPQMRQVPSAFNGTFDYESNISLHAIRLPLKGNYKVMMVAECLDSTSTSLYLCTMNQDYVLQDRLLLYEQKVVERHGVMGLTRLEYYITSDYEITLVRIFRSEEEGSEREESARRYLINEAGLFEEVIIEI